MYKPKIKIQSLDDSQIKIRLDFLDEFEKNKSIFRNLIFCDETRISMNSDKNYDWRKKKDFSKKNFQEKKI